MTDNPKAAGEQKIVIIPDGPYLVKGGIRLVRKSQVVSEYGEPLTWKTEGVIEMKGDYLLCRCGKSEAGLLCDSTHGLEGFDGTETADIRPTVERQVTLDSKGIIVRQDVSLCMESGFCATRKSTLEQLAARTTDTEVRSLLMAMIERCPSGSLVYQVSPNEGDLEPDLPVEIAATIEITDEGPIEGPFWVTGNIPIERSDGQPFETRNRVTLCNCGLSKNKPLCDGTHRHHPRKPLSTG